jgi:hypothetical protein
MSRSEIPAVTWFPAMPHFSKKTAEKLLMTMVSRGLRAASDD